MTCSEPQAEGEPSPQPAGGRAGSSVTGDTERIEADTERVEAAMTLRAKYPGVRGEAFEAVLDIELTLRRINRILMSSGF